MINLSPEILTAILLGGVLFGVLLGYPLAIVIGGIGLLVGLSLYGLGVVAELYHQRLFYQITNYVLLAVPFFVFMGDMLEKSGVTEGLYDAMYLWLGGLKGGLALATMIIGTILAACVGVIAASTTLLALVALPSMVKKGYDKSLASGTVCAGGTLGILIPPSVMLVVYGPMAQLSVGKLFFGAFLPGLLLSLLYCMYIIIFCLIKPEAGPPVSAAERQVPLSKKLRMLITALVPPMILITAVMGSIFFGVAAPTEAAAVGAFTAILLAVAYRKFTFGMLKRTAYDAVKLSGMILLIASLSFAFVGVFVRAGCGVVVQELITSAPGGSWGCFFIIMLVCFLLGLFIDWIGIVFILVPIITPIGETLGFDPLWFAMMVCVNLQTSFMTPPFAYAIFFVKGAASPELGVTINHIIRGVIPFVVLILVGLFLCVAFPEIILWLPNKMIK